MINQKLFCRLVTNVGKNMSAKRSLTRSVVAAGQQQVPTTAEIQSPSLKPTYPKVDAISLVASDLDAMVANIHKELETELKIDSDLNAMSKYYFDGQGKAVRPVIAMTVGHAYNVHCGLPESDIEDIRSKQRKVAIISEMIHTASLVHDDILDR